MVAGWCFRCWLAFHHYTMATQFMFSPQLGQPMHGHMQQPQSGNAFHNGGFAFRKRFERVDWRKMASVDIEHISRTLDFNALQENIMNITFCNIETELVRNSLPSMATFGMLMVWTCCCYCTLYRCDLALWSMFECQSYCIAWKKHVLTIIFHNSHWLMMFCTTGMNCFDIDVRSKRLEKGKTCVFTILQSLPLIRIRVGLWQHVGLMNHKAFFRLEYYSRDMISSFSGVVAGCENNWPQLSKAVQAGATDHWIFIGECCMLDCGDFVVHCAWSGHSTVLRVWCSLCSTVWFVILRKVLLTKTVYPAL